MMLGSRLGEADTPELFPLARGLGTPVLGLGLVLGLVLVLGLGLGKRYLMPALAKNAILL